MNTFFRHWLSRILSIVAMLGCIANVHFWPELSNTLSFDAKSMFRIQVNDMKRVLSVRIRFLFVVGSEGSGHHLLKGLMYSMRSSGNFSQYFFVKNKNIAHKSCDFYQSHRLNSSSEHPVWNPLIQELNSTHLSTAITTALDAHDHGSFNLFNSFNRFQDIDIPLVVLFGLQASYPCHFLTGDHVPNLVQLYMLVKDLQDWCNENRGRVHFNESLLSPESRLNRFNIEYIFNLRAIVLNRPVASTLYSACSRFLKRRNCRQSADFLAQVSFPYMIRQLYFFNKYISHQYIGQNENRLSDTTLSIVKIGNNMTNEYSEEEKYVLEISKYLENQFIIQELYKDDSESFFKIWNQDAMVKSVFDNQTSVVDANRIISQFSSALIHLLGLPQDGNHLQWVIDHLQTSLSLIATGDIKGGASSRSRLTTKEKMDKLRGKYEHTDFVLSLENKSWQSFLVNQFALIPNTATRVLW